MRAKRWKRCWSPAKSNGTGSRQWRMLSRPEKVTEPVTLFWQKGLLFGQKEANNAPRFRWMFKIADFGETASLCSVSPDLLRPLQLPAAVRPNVSGCCHPEPVRHASEEGRAIGGPLAGHCMQASVSAAWRPCARLRAPLLSRAAAVPAPGAHASVSAASAAAPSAPAGSAARRPASPSFPACRTASCLWRRRSAASRTRSANRS